MVGKIHKTYTGGIHREFALHINEGRGLMLTKYNLTAPQHDILERTAARYNCCFKQNPKIIT